MKRILDFIHGLIMWTFTLITFLCIDLPLKIILCVLILVLGLVSAVFYPLYKRIYLPGWCYGVYDYATKRKYSIAKRVYKAWQ